MLRAAQQNASAGLGYFSFFLLFRLFDTEIPLLIWQGSGLRGGRKEKGRQGHIWSRFKPVLPQMGRVGLRWIKHDYD
jgi:hypothetical protein